MELRLHYYTLLAPALQENYLQDEMRPLSKVACPVSIANNQALHGKSNRDIAEALYIAPHTVKNHVYRLYQKLGIKSRFELVSLFLDYAKR